MKLLVVDDVDANRKLLRVRFEAEGHTILAATDGVEALEILARENVDAMLSDILMPRMDGYRLCHEIRSSERLRNLPIVVYTATYTLQSDEKLALMLGADRYLKKPAQFPAILEALNQAIASPHGPPRPAAGREVEVLRLYNAQLVSKLEERNIDLAEANERLLMLDRAKNEFLCVISHELRAPLTGLFMLGDMVTASMPATPESADLGRIFRRSRDRILALLEDALLLARMDVHAWEMEATPVSLGDALHSAVEAAAQFAASRGVSISLQAAATDFVAADPELLVRSLRSLLETAVKFCKPGGTIELARQTAGDSATITIDSHGWTVSPDALPKFFDIFSIGDTLTPGGDLGLGPAVAHRILSLFGATVSVANRELSGIRLTVSCHTVPATVRGAAAAAYQ